MPLSALAVKNAKPAEKPYKLTDGGGLYLLVQPTGSKLWRLDYRFAGRRKTLAVGPLTDVSIAEAREAREEARRLLRAGEDPSAVKQARRAAAVVEAGKPTFEQAARTWMKARRARWRSATSWARVENRFVKDVFPVVGHLPVDEVEPRHMLDIARTLEARGAVESARRLMNHCGDVFTMAIAEGMAERDPTRDILKALRTKPRPKHRAALWADDLPEFFRRLAAYDGEEQTRLALEVIVYTFVRTVELREARWEEFGDLDAEEPTWRIPGERMKMDRDHIVPLAPRVVAILKRLREIAGDSEFVLPSRLGASVMSENTMLGAMWRMGYKGRATVHGFRRTASTTLNESGLFNEDWIERQLAHIEGNSVRRAYNAAEWLGPRRQMMLWWADFLDGKRNAPGANPDPH